jgi:hypothetical protein
MPQLPSCFPTLTPSSIQLRSFELYHSSAFTVLVKADKLSNITFEYFDARDNEGEGLCSTSGGASDEELRYKSGHKRGRPCVRKKMGYLITTMTSPPPMSSESNDMATHMSYPALKGIFLAEEYRNQKVQVDDDDKEMQPLSHLMMGVYHKFLAYLYHSNHVKSCKGAVSNCPSTLTATSSPNMSSSNSLNGSCSGSGDSGSSGGSRNCSIIKPSSVFLKTGCAMKKVLVCKLLASQGWVPTQSSKRFDVTVLPRQPSPLPSLASEASAGSVAVENNASCCVLGSRTISAVKGVGSRDSHVRDSVTRICSPVLSPQAMQSRLFTPRTCKAQNAEIVPWEEALAQSRQHRQQQLEREQKQEQQEQQDEQQEGFQHAQVEQCEAIQGTATLNIANTRTSISNSNSSTRGCNVGSVVTVNCEYFIEVDTLLALVSQHKGVKGGRFAYD